MEMDWIGKAVSITCEEKLGVFQGIIKDLSASHITIVRAFRNGVPLRKQDAEVTLRATDILDIKQISAFNGQNTVTPTVINKPAPVKQPNFVNGHSSPLMANAGAVLHTPNGSNQPPPPQLPHWQNNGVDAFNESTKINGYRSTPTSSRATSVQLLQAQPPQQHSNSNKSSPPMISNKSVAQFFGNMVPTKVEVRMGTAFTSCSSSSSTNVANGDYKNPGAKSKPIDIARPNSYHGQANYSNGNSMRNTMPQNGNGGATKKQRQKLRRENSMRQHQQQQHQTFGTSADDPEIHEDFDFEGNLALFNKQAIWHDIEADVEQQNSDLNRPSASASSSQLSNHQQQSNGGGNGACQQPQAKYRHDENILVSEPLKLRQIVCNFKDSHDYVTDEGLIIPTIPPFVRWKIEAIADKNGLSIQRQTDMLVRGASDLTIQLLGGARRLMPENRHQWPKIVIICEDAEERSINLAAATGRLLASHGLKTSLCFNKKAKLDEHNEILLFKATGNQIIFSVNTLFTPDLVILISNGTPLSQAAIKWLKENRASLLAIDPPPSGIVDVDIKYSILPILPLYGISSNNCGKLYLCNLGIPEKFYKDADIMYKSPFGHKFVIPIHAKD